MYRSDRISPPLLVLCAAALACTGSPPTSSSGERRAVGALQLEVGAGPRAAAAGTSDTAVHWSVPPGERGTATAPRPIVAPDTVSAGEPFEVTVHTIGENGCWRADGQELRVDGRTATIVPYDVHSGADVCTEVLGYLPHRATVTISTPGLAVIRVDGRRVRQGDRSWEIPVRAERTVVVR